MDIQTLRNCELKILKYIDDICTKHNITYYLCGGTLLGAVRHKGFIPWDDDIDIFMPREDYNKLMNIMLQSNDRYKVVNSINVKNFYLPFSKIVDSNTFLKEKYMPEIKELGVFVDVFPIDGVSKNKYLQRLQYIILVFFRKLTACKVNKNIRNKNFLRVIIRNLISTMLIGIPLNRLIRIINKISSIYSYNKSEYVVSWTGSYGMNEILRKDIVFSKSIKIEFENHMFNAPIGFDVYLSQIYGDYRKLPPIEKRKTHHYIEKCYMKGFEK